MFKIIFLFIYMIFILDSIRKVNYKLGKYWDNKIYFIKWNLWCKYNRGDSVVDEGYILLFIVFLYMIYIE